MNRLLKVLTPLLGMIFLVLLAVSLQLMISNPLVTSDKRNANVEKAHHYAFYLPGSDSSFFRRMKAGAEAAAEARNCAILFHPIDSDPVSFEMSPLSGVDGIAVFSYKNDRTTTDILENITRSGVPIVQVENEIISSPNTFLIGTNSFEAGKSIGRIALDSDKRRLSVALFFSEKNPSQKIDANLVEIGMKSILGRRLSNLYTASTTLSPIDAERAIYEMLGTASGIDIIVLTDSSDTLVTIQAIIDLNLVGKVQIIGAGDDAFILEYIRKGVVLGSIVRDPYRMGYGAVNALKEISLNGYTSAYVDTGIDILTISETGISRSGGL